MEWRADMPAKRDFPKAKSDDVFGQTRKAAKMFRARLYGLDGREQIRDTLESVSTEPSHNFFIRAESFCPLAGN